MNLSVADLEAYMRKAAALTHDVVERPPFVLFFNPHDALRFYNYAKLLEPVGDAPSTHSGEVLSDALAEVRAAFVARDRLPRFEFIAEFAPDFGAALAAAGFTLEDRTVLLTCTRETFRPAPLIPGLEIITLTPDSPAEDLLAHTEVQQRGFGDTSGEQPTLADAEHFRPKLERYAAFLARLDGVPVAAGDFTAPLDGFTELVGIATLEAYRRRGIASALTAQAAQTAFERGVEVAFLTAADERAGRVYERVGFRPYATALAYCAE
ncbi:MAG: GNAT family N-acetyltransferase [Chloroflexi bacterium]|nr:GNAT family N-acetyltransferase [Chloroflexota bacterium]